METKGITAIVTGAASGLGAAVARRLTADGAKVVIFDMNAEAGEAVAAELGGGFQKVDVTDEASVAAALDAAEAAFGTARVLVNCAGIAPPAKVIDREGAPLPLSSFSKIIQVNLIGTFNVLSQFAARLHKADPLGEERGVVVNTASVAAFEGQIGQAAYAASKGGVASMALPIAREFARYGIRVNTIAPGIFLTPMLESLPQEAQDSLGAQVPFPSRLGKPSEFADLAAAIIANPMLNGEVIRLDGAIRMGPK
ncbi:SDR family NAD(P)-dependent oxidoreductase [Salipiger abyssi]|uniref:SDR family NAD(P)-dependent oxidoreductase n=1 Tax=Salipiger abyssi TaxID=1250539 RepID=UPI0040586161